MQVEGEFERFVVVDDDERVFYGVPFVQNGFSYTAYLGFDYHVTVDEGVRALGYVDGRLVASGTITALAPTTMDGERFVRVTVAPQSPHEFDATRLRSTE